jgi:hypothetical protein
MKPLCFCAFYGYAPLLEIALFCLIMRHFATQTLATGNSDAESKLLSASQFSTHKLPEVSEAR